MDLLPDLWTVLIWKKISPVGLLIPLYTDCFIHRYGLLLIHDHWSYYGAEILWYLRLGSLHSFITYSSIEIHKKFVIQNVSETI